MTTQPERACAVCDVTDPEIDYSLITRACGHVLCPICHGRECPVCAGDVPNEEEEEQTPRQQAIQDATVLMWGYGEIYDVPDAARYAYEQLAMILTCLRLWAEDAGFQPGAAWHEAYLRSEAIKQARKVS